MNNEKNLQKAIDLQIKQGNLILEILALTKKDKHAENLEKIHQILGIERTLTLMETG